LPRISIADRRALRARVIVLLVALRALGCRTREDAAHKLGREGALVAAASCRDAAAVDSCHETICRERCAPFSDSNQLAATCFTQCMGRGTCSSDLDCGPERACTMIAPRVRRCEPRIEAGVNSP
jgi:hypothetical protein